MGRKDRNNKEKEDLSKCGLVYNFYWQKISN